MQLSHSETSLLESGSAKYRTLLSGLPRCIKALTFDGCVTGRATSGQFRPRSAGMDLSYESEVGGDLTPS